MKRTNTKKIYNDSMIAISYVLVGIVRLGAAILLGVLIENRNIINDDWTALPIVTLIAVGLMLEVKES
jgi:hypothetical protein